MAKKKNTIPSEFNDLLSGVYGSPEETQGISNMDDIMTIDTPLEDDNIKEPPANTEDGKDNDNPDNIDNNSDDNNSDDIDDINVNQDDLNQETHSDDNHDDLSDVNESQLVQLLFDAVGESLGWDMDLIDEEDKPQDVPGLVEYLKDVVVQNSKPHYANEDVQALDEYVKNGGNFEDFYRLQQETFSLDKVDLEEESDQKAVVRQFMKYNGYSDEQINKRISRFEDADMLYEESEDALDRLKEIKLKELEYAQLQQEEYAKAQKEQSDAFLQSVTTQINQLDNIRGIAIPKQDRKALYDYIFKVDQNGKSQYAKDFEKNLTKNLIESAYFTMKADALISTAKRTGETSATLKLLKALRHTTKNHSVYNADDKQRSVTDIVNGLF